MLPGKPGSFVNGHPSLLKPGQIPNPNGKPSSFTEEIGEEIVNLLWTGECKSITAVARRPGMPTTRTVYNWAKTYPEFGSNLMEARRGLADVYDDEIETIKDRMLEGKLDPSAANVAIRSNQWKAMATNPLVYSNKSYIEKNETVNVTTHHVNRLEIDGLSDEQLDALENALSARLLTGPDDLSDTAGED